MAQKNFKEGLPPREQLGEFGKLLDRWEKLMKQWESDVVYHTKRENWEERDRCQARVNIYRVTIEDLEYTLWREIEAKKAGGSLVSIARKLRPAYREIG